MQCTRRIDKDVILAPDGLNCISDVYSKESALVIQLCTANRCQAVHLTRCYKAELGHPTLTRFYFTELPIVLGRAHGHHTKWTPHPRTDGKP